MKNEARLGVALFVSMRPRQWYKNLIIYLAFFFTIDEAWSLDADTIAALQLFGVITLAFLIFSALTGAIYLLNDILDAKSDRRHPRKRNRPIASGRLPVAAAWIAAVALTAIALGGAFTLNPAFGGISLLYALANIAYSLALKHIVLVDVFVISGGMVLRAVAGAAIMGVPISPWLYLCTALAALLLALIKRRSQLTTAGVDAASQRPSLSRYSVESLDKLVVITATASLIAYSLYTFTAPNLPTNGAMMLTIPFVAFCLFRYLILSDSADSGENPEDLLLGDIPLIATALLWLCSAAVILAVFR
ncbi:MAG: decaprenyl-phosphate phosphoribosyltransferase [Chloroflexi bacterium]|nr:decaprenyl-phosphate phosphoribosyltransferase [Chloroflexota bacterium]